jgi:phosphate-selective porin OprO/OprP
MHVAASYTYRVAEFPNGNNPPQGGTGAAGPREIEFAARPQLRDAVGDYGNGTLSGNSKRIIDTGAIAASDDQVIGLEWAYVNGPIYLQAEWAFANVQNAASLAGKTNTIRTLKNNTKLGSLWFDGGYIQASYMLTGESRTYDRRLGRLGSNYIASPYTPFWLVRADEGGNTFGRGAWEVAARVNYLDLNDKLVRGGRSDAAEFGVNWYLNNNMKFQFMYLWQDRYDLKPGLKDGDFRAFAIRTQFFF